MKIGQLVKLRNPATLGIGIIIGEEPFETAISSVRYRIYWLQKRKKSAHHFLGSELEEL